MENKNQTYTSPSIVSSKLVQKYNQGWKIFLEKHLTNKFAQKS